MINNHNTSNKTIKKNQVFHASDIPVGCTVERTYTGDMYARMQDGTLRRLEEKPLSRRAKRKLIVRNMRGEK